MARLHFLSALELCHAKFQAVQSRAELADRNSALESKPRLSESKPRYALSILELMSNIGLKCPDLSPFRPRIFDLKASVLSIFSEFARWEAAETLGPTDWDCIKASKFKVSKSTILRVNPLPLGRTEHVASSTCSGKSVAPAMPSRTLQNPRSGTCLAIAVVPSWIEGELLDCECDDIDAAITASKWGFDTLQCRHCSFLPDPRMRTSFESVGTPVCRVGRPNPSCRGTRTTGSK